MFPYIGCTKKTLRLRPSRHRGRMVRRTVTHCNGPPEYHESAHHLDVGYVTRGGEGKCRVSCRRAALPLRSTDQRRSALLFAILPLPFFRCFCCPRLRRRVHSATTVARLRRVIESVAKHFFIAHYFCLLLEPSFPACRKPRVDC